MMLYKNGFDLQNLLTSLLEQDTFSHSFLSQSLNQLRCEGCGLTYKKLREEGKLGCSVCYQTFRSYLEPMLQQIHGSSVHLGKVLESQNTLLRDLQKSLQEALLEENYEQAAELRDKIKALPRGEAEK